MLTPSSENILNQSCFTGLLLDVISILVTQHILTDINNHSCLSLSIIQGFALNFNVMNLKILKYVKALDKSLYVSGKQVYYRELFEFQL